MSTSTTISSVTPVQVNDGSAGTVYVRNCGASQVIFETGTERVILWPGRATAISPRGVPLTARLPTGLAAAKISYTLDNPDLVTGWWLNDADDTARQLAP